MEKHEKLEVSFLANHAKANVSLDRKMAEAKKGAEEKMQWCVRMKILNKIVEDYQLNIFVMLLRHVHRRTGGYKNKLKDELKKLGKECFELDMAVSRG